MQLRFVDLHRGLPNQTSKQCGRSGSTVLYLLSGRASQQPAADAAPILTPRMSSSCSAVYAAAAVLLSLAVGMLMAMLPYAHHVPAAMR